MPVKLIIITGAGSSDPYQFPTGGKLLDDIILQCKTADYDNSYPSSLDTDRDIYLPFGYTKPELNDYAKTLVGTNQTSVDAACFQLDKESFSEKSKLLIGYNLQYYHDTFSPTKKYDDDWLKCLFSLIAEFKNTKDVKPENLQFITFNYDHIIEDKIDERISFYNREGLKEWAEFYARLNPVKHIYGKLEKIPPGTLKELSRIRESSSKLLLMRGDSEDQSETEETRQLFLNAEAAFFLGFGFHELNLKRLGFPRILESEPGRPTISKQFATTVRGLNQAEISRMFKGHGTWLPMEESCTDLIWNNRARIKQLIS